jgi:hypothetical protein
MWRVEAALDAQGEAAAIAQLLASVRSELPAGLDVQRARASVGPPRRSDDARMSWEYEALVGGRCELKCIYGVWPFDL